MPTTSTRRAGLAGAAAVPVLAVPAIARDAESTYDRQAAVARLEYIVKVLRQSSVCDNWKLDEAKALHVLANFDDDEDALIEWIREHGQSFDWVLLGDPGGMIYREAARSPAAVSAIATEPDPIFAAIEAHKAASAAFVAFVNRPEFKGVDLPDAPVEELHDSATAAAETMLDVQPTSMAGVIALLKYIYECDRADEYLLPDERYEEHATPSRRCVSFHAYACKNAAEALQTMGAPQLHAFGGDTHAQS
jgi:hypothetical protein